MTSSELKEKIYSLYKPSCNEEVAMKRVLADGIFSFFETYLLSKKSQSLRVLDVGCGKQPFRPLIEELGFLYFGLDYKQNQDNMVDYIWPIDKPFSEQSRDFGTYNVIICTEVLEHVVNWDITFSNFKSLLQENGLVLLTSPFVYQLHEEPVDFWRPTPHSFRFFAEKNDLTVIESVKAGNGIAVLGTIMQSLYSFYPKVPLSKVELVKYFFIKKAIKFLKKMLLQMDFIKKIEVNSPLYLSNFIVLQNEG